MEEGDDGEDEDGAAVGMEMEVETISADRKELPCPPAAIMEWDMGILDPEAGDAS